MQWGEFTLQMNRIASTFGKNAYGDERVQIIWREVKDFSTEWMIKTVDRFIGELRQAPLMPEFREEIAREREKLWQVEKKQREKDAKGFFDGIYAPEDKKTICQFIQKRLRHQVSDSDYQTFVSHLKHAASSVADINQRIKCNACDDSGLVFHRDEENYEWIYRCFCAQGDRQSKAYQRYERSHAAHASNR
jgi:hypothetical protein